MFHAIYYNLKSLFLFIIIEKGGRIMSCLFCRIIDKEIPSKIIYENEQVLAFEDTNPQAPTHILVVPKKHISTSLEISGGDNELIGLMFQAANKIAKDKGVAERGFRLVMNCNQEAGQTVFHIHLHLLAGRRMSWPPG
jgi:histidine triad (HIT) family protein